jgi:hypothetical protein
MQRKTSLMTIGSFSIPETNDSFPVIALPSGRERAIAKIRPIPHTEMVEVYTLPDASDGGKSLALRIKASTPIVRVTCFKAVAA